MSSRWQLEDVVQVKENKVIGRLRHDYHRSRNTFKTSNFKDTLKVLFTIIYKTIHTSFFI